MTVNNVTKKEVRVLLAHPYTLVREGFTDLLNGAGFNIVGDVGHEEDLIRLAIRYNPDILLLAWDLPKVPAETIRRLVVEKNFPGAIVMFGPPQSAEFVMQAMLAGVRGYLSTNLPGEEFWSRLRAIARGDFVVSQDMAFNFGHQMGVFSTPASDGLSGRERQVLSLVATGATNKEIAEVLIVTENTVKVHLRHILDKLDLRNRQQATAYAVREGMMGVETIRN